MGPMTTTTATTTTPNATDAVSPWDLREGDVVCMNGRYGVVYDHFDVTSDTWCIEVMHGDHNGHDEYTVPNTASIDVIRPNTADPDYHHVTPDGTVVADDPGTIVVTTDDAPTTPIGDMGLDGPYATADSIGYGLSIYYTADRCAVVVCIDYVGGPASAQPTADTRPLFVATVADADHVMAAWRVASRWMADRVADDVDGECGIVTTAYRTVTR